MTKIQRIWLSFFRAQSRQYDGTKLLKCLRFGEFLAFQCIRIGILEVHGEVIRLIRIQLVFHGNVLPTNIQGLFQQLKEHLPQKIGVLIQPVLPVLLPPGSRLARTASASEDDFALYRNVMQTGALKFSMVLLAVFALYVVVCIGHFLMSIQHAAIEVVVHTGLLQNGQEIFQLQLQSVRVPLGHYVVIQRISFSEDIGGYEEAGSLIIFHTDGLHYGSIENTLGLPVRQSEFARPHYDQLATSLLIFDDKLSRVVDLAVEGLVQLGTTLLLKVPEDRYTRVQIIVLLGEILLLELLGKVLDDLPMLTVLVFVLNLDLV